MRKLVLFSMALLCFASLSISQTPLEEAVDFTATDINGTSHTLFDYLNDGKYVLLEFTATS